MENRVQFAGVAQVKVPANFKNVSQTMVSHQDCPLLPGSGGLFARVKRSNSLQWSRRVFQPLPIEIKNHSRVFDH